MSRALPSVAVILLLSLASCAGEEESPQPSAEPAGNERTTLERVEDDGATAPQAQPRQPARSDAPNLRLSLHPRARRVPADVALGPLEDQLAGPAAVIDAIESLFDAVAGGEVPGEILEPAIRGQLENRLDYMMARSAIAPEVRIGRMSRVSERTYRAPVVAFGRRGGRTTGEIYVANSDGTWYISDILVDFTRIDEESQQPVFEPGSSGPTLLSF